MLVSANLKKIIFFCVTSCGVLVELYILFWKHYHFKKCVTYPNTHFIERQCARVCFENFLGACIHMSIFIYTIYAHVRVLEMFKYFSGLFIVYTYTMKMLQRSFKLLRRISPFICLYTRRHNLFNVAIILCIDSNGFRL